jgi:hypothetical protein
MRSGLAYLPLHGGSAPGWLFSKMKKLAREISFLVIKEYGPEGFLERLSDPLWFQALGCVLGYDWHSSGVTTVTCGALKEGLKGLEKELGFFVCGGKGGTSRRTPFEIEELAQRRLINVSPYPLIEASKTTAKVDNTALQDGYQLYHHSFFVTKSGKWVVIQQGMNSINRWARRYHWFSEKLEDYVCEPHTAVCCDYTTTPLNMVAKESEEARHTSCLIATKKPEVTLGKLRHIKELKMPKTHSIFFSSMHEERFKKILRTVYERQPQSFLELLRTKGVGPKTIRALALLSDLIYGAKLCFKDVVSYSFAHGGKDGHPYPVDLKTYSKSISILKSAVRQARIGRTDKISSLKRLSKIVGEV